MISKVGNTRDYTKPSEAEDRGLRAHCVDFAGGYSLRMLRKYYGLKLRIQILGVSGRRIRCRVETESSQLDSAVSVGGIPGVRTNHVKTEIDATESEPVLLTGLFQSAASKDVEKLPILGQIPIIGELFKSRGFRNEESELLIALIPYQEMARTSLPLKGREEFQNLSTSWEVTD